MMAEEDSAQERQIESEALYKEMAVKEDELEIVLDDEKEGVKSLSQKIEETPNLSDMQTASLKLFPDDLGDLVANKVMIGRIAPDAFLPLLHMMTKADIAKADPSKPINVEQCLLSNYILLSVGLDGKGRIDELELAGAARDEEESDKLSKLLG